MTSPGFSEACIADVTGDSLSDLLSIDGGGTLAIARGIGDGVHGEVSIHEVGSGIDGLVRGLAAGDLEGDGDLDLVFTWSHPMAAGGFVSVLVFENGIPGDRIDFVLDFQLNRVPFDLSLGDLNGDGRLDVVDVLGPEVDDCGPVDNLAHNVGVDGVGSAYQR